MSVFPKQPLCRLVLAVGCVGGGLAATATSAAAAPTGPPPITPRAFAAANPKAAPPQSAPDDIASLGGNLFVTYQNGVGPDGSPATTGTTQSTVVEYSQAGTVLESWLLTGRVDGLGADPARDRVLATVNEDLNSYLAVLTPTVASPQLYTYSPSPAEQAPGETSANGGTDSVSVGPLGTIYIAHSNPDPGEPSTAATYTVTLQGTTAKLTPLFAVNAPATDRVTGQAVTLALTDPDSNRFIDPGQPALPGTFLQVSQGDGQVIIVHHPHSSKQSLQRLVLKNAENTTQPTVDDIAEVTGPGTLYVVDQGAGTVQTIDTSGFTPGTLVVAQPEDSGNAGQLGVLDPATGVITHFATTFSSPKGLVFVPGGPVPAAPQVLLPVMLPLAAAAALGGGTVILRRRRAA